ncbi:uncharacterized protein FIBRA_01094 [Fibroporia radiculosa]|uniref:Uncharacterized protein n=1 Tax=Fibroporia radiculosa TaxID=599839 RepID=J4I8A7_9APHY|nr:uncharacterized protein FIBRA_01094 [Fibroporia radiculosa]CCL99081.1 predicted protein [Fibroporia radiculosa]
MSHTEQLALDVGFFDLKGSYDEAIWGNPTTVESDPSIREWVKGLRGHGGGGNVLKLRKLAQAQTQQRNADSHKEKEPGMSTIPSEGSRRTTLPLARKAAPKPSLAEPPPPHIPPPVETLKTPFSAIRKKLWRLYSANPKKYIPTPEVLQEIRRMPGAGDERLNSLVEHGASVVQERQTPPVMEAPVSASPRPRRPRRHPLDLSSSPPRFSSVSPQTRNGLPPATPSHWSPSIRGSPGRSEIPALELDAVSERHSPELSPVLTQPGSDSNSNDQRTSRLSPVVREPGQSQFVQLPEPEPESVSQLMVTDPPSPILTAPPPGQRPRSDVPPSILPPPSEPPKSTRSPFKVRQTDHSFIRARAPIIPLRPLHGGRRVPLPISGHLSPDPNVSGPGRILVPNSDISGSASQPSQQSQANPSSSEEHLRQSLSHVSQTQTQSESTSQSLPSIPSQLRNEVLPSASGTEDVPRNDADDIPEASVTAEPSSTMENVDQIVDPTATDQIGDRPYIPESEAHQQVAAVPSTPDAPGLVSARKESGSETEDEDADDELELDELLGSEHSTSANLSQSQEIRSEVDDLDSDDARTKEMVASYIAPEERNEITSPFDPSPEIPLPDMIIAEKGGEFEKERSLSTQSVHGPQASSTSTRVAGKSMPPPGQAPCRVSHHVEESEQPLHTALESLPPPSPTNDGDYRQSVLLGASKDASKASIPVMPLESRLTAPTTHDPEVWALPSFQRDVHRPEINATADRPQENLRRLPARKRIVSISSSDEDERPAKRKKVTLPVRQDETRSAASSSSGGGRHISEGSKNASESVVATHTATTNIRQIDLRRSTSSSSSRSNSKKMKLRATITSWDVSSAGDCAQKSKDLQTRVEIPSGSTSVVKVNGPQREASAASHKGSGKDYPIEPHPVAPRMPKEVAQSRASTHASSTSSSEPSRQSAASGSRGALESESVAVNGDKQLGGYGIDLNMKRTEDGPPLVTWKDLEAILLRTGSSRYKQMVRDQKK